MRKLVGNDDQPAKQQVVQKSKKKKATTKKSKKDKKENELKVKIEVVDSTSQDAVIKDVTDASDSKDAESTKDAAKVTPDKEEDN